MAAPSGNKYICLITLIVVVTVNHASAKLPYGSPCKSDSQCRKDYRTSYKSFFESLDSTECKNGRCKCDITLQKRKFTNNNYECHQNRLGDISSLFKNECEPDDPNTCINGVCKTELIKLKCYCEDGFILVGETCREMLSAEHAEDCKTPASGPVPVCDYDKLMYCKSGGICGCYSGYLYDKEDKACISPIDYANKYYEETLVDLNEPCGPPKNGLPKNCNEEAHMICKDTKCKCKRDFYPVESNKTCENKTSYVEAHNLTSYKVMPGVYCWDNTDCIAGLPCVNNKCVCPHPCTFDKKKSACDCGKVLAWEGASSSIVVGIIGGIVIVVFWGYKITEIMNKGMYKSTRQRNYQNNVSAEAPAAAVPLTEPYRIKSSSTGGEAPASSPVPSYATTAPDAPAAPIGLSAPTASAPSQEQPPPYTEVPTSYPFNPAMPPTSDTYPPTNQYPVSTVPAYNPTYVAPSTTTAYPLSPVTGAAPDSVNPTVGAPTYPGGDATSPPPYTPTIQTAATAPPAVDIYKPVIY